MLSAVVGQSVHMIPAAKPAIAGSGWHVIPATIAAVRFQVK
jgi:hypothetical protein